MKSDLTINTAYRPAFQANVSEEFIKGAKSYYRNANQEYKFKKFMQKVSAFKSYDTDEYTIVHEKINLNGINQHVLYAIKDGMKPGEYIVLAVKDSYKKILEKFTHISDYEYAMKKVQQIKQQ